LLGEVESLIKEFAGSYRSVIENIKKDIMALFPNLYTGAAVLQLVLAQLVLYYQRFEDILKKCFRGSTFAEFVPTPTLTFYVKRHNIVLG
jgi:vacuolar protein sorting-associated protein 52